MADKHIRRGLKRLRVSCFVFREEFENLNILGGHLYFLQQNFEIKFINELTDNK